MSHDSNIFDMKSHEERLDALIRKTWSSSFMSNSKWRKLFEMLDQPKVGVDQLIWKFVGREPQIRGAVPPKEGLGPSYVSGSTFSAFPYKEIEWIEIPSMSIPYGWEKIPHKHRPQNLDRLLPLLASIGQFEMERRPTGLRLYGYRGEVGINSDENRQ